MLGLVYTDGAWSIVVLTCNGWAMCFSMPQSMLFMVNCTHTLIFIDKLWGETCVDETQLSGTTHWCNHARMDHNWACVCKISTMNIISFCNWLLSMSCISERLLQVYVGTVGYNAHDTVLSGECTCMCGVHIFLCIWSEEADNCRWDPFLRSWNPWQDSKQQGT